MRDIDDIVQSWSDRLFDAAYDGSPQPVKCCNCTTELLEENPAWIDHPTNKDLFFCCNDCLDEQLEEEKEIEND